MTFLAQIASLIKDDREVRSAVWVAFGTTVTSVASYILSHYDKVLAASLSGAGLAFLLWKWRKASKNQLCDRAGCPRRKVPTDVK